MSSNTAGFLVVFSDDISDEAAADVVDLLGLIKGVVDVRPVTHNTDQLLAQMRIDSEWRAALIDFLKQKTS